MTEQEAVAIIDEVLLSKHSIPAKLAMKDGIDTEAVQRLETAVSVLVPIYVDRDQVPKKIAAAFLDLSPDFERTMPLYPDEERDRIEDLMLRVISLGHDLFGA